MNRDRQTLLVAVAVVVQAIAAVFFVGDALGDLVESGIIVHIVIEGMIAFLTAAECDVALFALKGCDAAEIARLRGAAQGTVRAQLSQVYAKAGVTSQAGLVSLFLEDLL